MFLPLNYNPAVQYPLILLLHGGGEKGTDDQKQETVNYATIVVNHAKQPQYSAFVLAPQSTYSESGWYGYDSTGKTAWGGQTPEIANCRSMRLTLDALDHQLIPNYSIDTDRLYITGISDGGAGTWDQLAREPERWAAGVPIAGYGPPSRAERIAPVPVWAFMGAHDNIFDPAVVQEMITDLQGFGATPRYTVYPDFGHSSDVWDTTYNTTAMWDWMFAQAKPVPEPTAGAILAAGSLLVLHRRRRPGVHR